MTRLSLAGNTQSIFANKTMRSLQEIMLRGGEQGTITLFFITRINPAASSGKTQVQMQRGASGRNQINNVSHTRTVTLLCPNSEPGNNMAVMFHGNGNNPQLFQGDPGIVNDGTLRKCVNDVY